MEVLLTILLILFSLSILIVIHELGHFWAARFFNIKVETFSLFFPPKIFSFKWGDTEYQLGSIPLGGYVKIAGMIDESMDTDQLKGPVEDWEFRSKPVWQRAIVMLGGIVMNVLLGIILFSGLKYVYGDQKVLISEVSEYGMYVPDYTLGHQLGLRTGDQLLSVSGELPKYFEDAATLGIIIEEDAYFEIQRQEEKIRIAVPDTFMDAVADAPDSAKALFFPGLSNEIALDSAGRGVATKAGILSKDVIAQINGQKVNCFLCISPMIKDLGGKEAVIGIRRSGVDTLMTFNVTFEPEARLGVTPGGTIAQDTMNYGFVEAVSVGTKTAFTAVFDQVKAQKKIFTGKASASKSVTGPIGMAVMLYDRFKVGGWRMFWTFTALISMILAYMNLLPIPGLDGGHLMFLTYEAITGREPSEKFMTIAQYAGMILVLGLMVMVLGLDIKKYILPSFFN